MTDPKDLHIDASLSVRCATCDKTAWLTGPLPEPEETLSAYMTDKTRELLARYGWGYVEGKLTCPECQPQES